MTELDPCAHRSYKGEPALADIFAEPIVKAMMRVDGLIEADLRKTLADAEARSGRPPSWAATSRPFTPVA